MLRMDSKIFDYSIEQQTAHITRAVLNDDLESYELWSKRKSKEVWKLDILEDYSNIEPSAFSGKLDLIRLNRVEMFKKLYRDDFFHSYMTEVLNLRVQAARFNLEIFRWLNEEDAFLERNKLYYINDFYRRLCQYDDIPKASIEYLLKKFKEKTNSLAEPLEFAVYSEDGGYHPLLFTWVLEDAEAEILKGKSFLTKENLVDLLCKITSQIEIEEPQRFVSSKLELLRIILNHHRINANTYGEWCSTELFKLPKMSAVNIAAFFDLPEALGVLVAHGADIQHLSMQWLQRKPIQKMLKMLKDTLPKSHQICAALDAFRNLNTKDLSPKDPRFTLVALMQKVALWGKGKFTADDYDFLDELPDLACLKKELETVDNYLPVLIDLCKEPIRKAQAYRPIFDLKWQKTCLPSSLISLIGEYHREIPLPTPIVNKAWHPPKERDEYFVESKPREISRAELEVKAFMDASKQLISKEHADKFMQTLRHLLALALKPLCTDRPTDFHSLFRIPEKFARLQEKDFHHFLRQNLSTLADKDVCLAVYLLLNNAAFDFVGERLLRGCPKKMYQFLLNPVVAEEKECKDQGYDFFIHPEDFEYKLCLLKFAVKKVLITLGVSIEEMNVTNEDFMRKFQSDVRDCHPFRLN